ncbi:MAG TPA: serine O-acetyltransferase EpsC [Candidatus Binatia bacterium]|jgi:serine O-acetyltransferase|nr:serine O-acetyltransferase EpsC [Candidatus Binatia bacterium]
MNALNIQPDLFEEPGHAAELDEVVDALTAANLAFLPEHGHRPERQLLPSPEALEVIVSDLRAILFPAHFGPADRSEDGIRDYIAQRLDATLLELQEQVRRGFLFTGTHGDDAACHQRAVEVMREFTRRLPAIRGLLGSDVRAAYDGDPAATSLDEAVFCYPSITAITHHRIAHQLNLLGVPLIPRIITEIAHDATGIDIHPGARIGASFFIDHGTGVVIGETAVIGERVRLYQGVTLGAKSFPADDRGLPIKGGARHPIVEDDVTIYAGATILGRITIGRGSSIGGNVWLTRGVSPGSWVSQAQARDDLFDGGSGI